MPLLRRPGFGGAYFLYMLYSISKGYFDFLIGTIRGVYLSYIPPIFKRIWTSYAIMQLTERAISNRVFWKCVLLFRNLDKCKGKVDMYPKLVVYFTLDKTNKIFNRKVSTAPLWNIETHWSLKSLKLLHERWIDFTMHVQIYYVKI